MALHEVDAKKSFRAAFYARLGEANLSDVSAKTGIAKNTLYSWATPGRGLPDIYEASLIAAASDAAVCWLAFNSGARDPEIAKSAANVSAALERSPGLRELLGAYMRATDAQRSALEAVAKTIPEAQQPQLPTAVAVKRKVIGVRPAEKRTKKVDRRWELARYHLSQDGAGIKITGYTGLAAGPGRELEKCNDLLYVREAIPHRNVSYARVAGDSMVESILRGDRILLKEHPTPVVLPPRGDDPKNNLSILKTEVPHESIWVLQINEENPTLKRVLYDTRAGAQDWRLMIVADNQDEWMPYAVTRNDKITFWAQFMGLLEVG